MANFIEVASRVDSPRGRAVIADILSNSKMLSALSALSAFEMDTTVSNYRPFSVSSALQARAIGSNFTYTYAAPPSAQSLTQAIVGAAVPIDRAYYRDAALGGNAIATWFEKTIKKYAVQFAKDVDDSLFAGDGTSNAIKGLSAYLDGSTDIPGFSGVKGVENAANYSTISSAKHLDLRFSASSTWEAEAYAFKEMLLRVLASMESPSVLACNRTAWARIQSVASKLGMLGEPTNEFFKTPTIAGLQTIILPTTAIPSTEDDDTATPLEVTTSLYIMSPAEMQLSVVTNGFDYLEAPYLEAKEAGEEKWEMGVAWKIENSDAVKRIRNIRV